MLNLYQSDVKAKVSRNKGSVHPNHILYKLWSVKHGDGSVMASSHCLQGSTVISPGAVQEL